MVLNLWTALLWLLEGHDLCCDDQGREKIATVIVRLVGVQ